MKLACAAVVLTSTIASANPAAEKLFQDGRELLKQNKLDEACDMLRRSSELEPSAGVLLNLGDCEERRGRIATAWAVFVRVRPIVAAKKSDPRYALEADKRVAALKTKLPYVTVRTPSPRPDGFVVKRDGSPVANAELDLEVPIDPGSYVIEASAPNHQTWTQTTPVTVGQKVVVEIPALQPATATTTTTTVVTPTATPTTSTTATVEPADSGTLRRAGIGIAAGLTHDFDPVVTLRVPLQLAAAGKLRLLPHASYAYDDDFTDDPYHNRHYFGVGLGADYVTPVSPTLSVAFGVGFGLELIDDEYEPDRLLKRGYGLARVSPLYRIGKTLDLAFHLELFVNEDDVLGRGAVGVDYFFY